MNFGDFRILRGGSGFSTGADRFAGNQPLAVSCVVCSATARPAAMTDSPLRFGEAMDGDLRSAAGCSPSARNPRGGARQPLLLFPWLAHGNFQLRIPADVYPVYGELCLSPGIAYETFPTIPELVLPEDGDVLLLPNPLKPAGRWLQWRETEALRTGWERVPGGG